MRALALALAAGWLAAAAPARGEPPPAAAAFRLCRGLVFFRLRSIKLGLSNGSQKPGQVLAVVRDGPDPPPYGAEQWKPAGGRWSYEFGGRRLEKGDGRLVWEWTA